MEAFDLSNLSSDREHLNKILRAFTELQVKIGKMVSRDNLLKFFGQCEGRKHSESSTNNYLTVIMDYLGDDDRCYFKPGELSLLIANKERRKFPVPSYAQPLGWDDEMMDKSIKSRDGAEFDPQQLKNVLSYLLRPDFSNMTKSEYFGIIFCNNEMIATTGQVMLIQSGMPVVTIAPRLLGYDAAVSLYSILRTPHVTEVHMGVSRKSGTFGVRVELDDGAEMYFWSKPRYRPIDGYKDPRPVVDARSIGFVVHSQFLEPLLNGTIEAVQGKEKPVIYFQTTDSGLGYTSYGVDDTYAIPARGIYQGEIPMIRSMGTENVSVCVRADNLLQAVKGMGESVQFIIPHHPLLGFQVHLIDPFYINCNPSQFALMAPYILDRDQVMHLEKLKRKANNAMEA